MNRACWSARHCSRHCPWGAVILPAIIRKRLACGINANKWPLRQLVLTPPLSTWLLGSSQMRRSAQKVARFESCPAPLLSSLVYSAPFFSSSSSFSLNLLQNVPNMGVLPPGRWLGLERGCPGERGASALPKPEQKSLFYVSCLLLNRLGFWYKVLE